MPTPVLHTTLDDQSVIYLTGKSIDDFLQGQLTCDLRDLTDQRAVPGALCTVKGRVISDLWVIRIADDRSALLLRRSIAEHFARHLARYAQFSRISVTLAAEATVEGLYGGPAGGLPLASPGDCAVTEGMFVLRSGNRTALIIREAAHAQAPDEARAWLRDRRCVSDAQGSAAGWRAEELLSGHYALESDDSERYTPQALNYDERGLVSFNKGCYTGQEVVARLHYKGKSKQRLQILEASPGVSVAAGAALHSFEAQSDSQEYAEGKAPSLGTVLRVETAADGRSVVAAMISADHRASPLADEQGAHLIPSASQLDT